MRTSTKLLTVLVLSFSAACATVDSTTDTSADEGDAATAGKFDLWQATDGQWHFHLKSGNGAILLTSEAYTSRTGAINGVLSTMDNGVDATQYVTAPATHGYTVQLRAGNNETIGFSEVYSTKSNATRAIGSCIKAVTTYLDKAEANTTGARAQIEAGASNQFRFNIFAANGQIVLSSESYTTEAAAWNGAFAVQDAAANDASFTIKTATDGRFYFTLTADNGQVVGVSQMYTTKAAAQSGITSVKSTLAKLDLI